jgi:hypothetical protein
MPRTLTVAPVRVRAGAEEEYVRTVGALATLSEPRGRRLWLFRSAADPDLFLECSESAAGEAHRAVATLPDDERALEARLRELGHYGADTQNLWHEVRL